MDFFKRDGKARPITPRQSAAGDSQNENLMRIKRLAKMDESAKLARAKDVDLITLPSGISGTNCGNCRYFVKLPVQGSGNCIHYRVMQRVLANQCCSLWDAIGTKRAWKK